MKIKNNDNIAEFLKGSFFFAAAMLVSLVALLSLRDICLILKSRDYSRFLLEIPVFIGLLQLAGTLFAKISAELRIRVKLFFKGIFLDTTVFIISYFKVDELFDFDEFLNKLFLKLSQDEIFDLKKHYKENKFETIFEVIVGKTSLTFSVKFDSDQVTISFKEIQNRHASVANYVEKANKIITNIEICANETIKITTLIRYEKSNPVIRELFINNDDNITLIYNDRKYTMTNEGLEVDSGISNQVDLVKKALMGDIRQN